MIPDFHLVLTKPEPDSGFSSISATWCDLTFQGERAGLREAPKDANTDNVYEVTVVAALTADGQPRCTMDVKVTVSKMDERGRNGHPVEDTAEGLGVAVTGESYRPRRQRYPDVTWQWSKGVVPASGTMRIHRRCDIGSHLYAGNGRSRDIDGPNYYLTGDGQLTRTLRAQTPP